MKRFIIVALLSLTPSLRAEDEGWLGDLRQEQQATEQLNQEAKAPGISPAAAAEIERQRQESLKKIETIADKRPENPAANLAVSKSLASVEEAPRAIPYAERGLKLAEKSGDPKIIRDALLTGSEVYAKAGRYDLARVRAERILKDNPKDKDALALYMQVKDRGAGSASAAKGSPVAGAGGASGASAGASAGALAAEAARGPGVAMTSASSLEAQKQIALGWSRIKLDPAAALKNFEAAITADPKGAATRVQRSRARLETGDARGALGDANDAVGFDPRLGEAYAARAEANRALGRSEADLLEDYEQAARLDGRFTDAYKTALARVGPTAQAGSAEGKGAAGESAPGGFGPLALLRRSPQSWGIFAFLCAMLAAAGGIIVPLALKRRRSDEDGSPPR